MIIKIKESELFTKEPNIRFSVQYKVEPTIWTELWKRYKLLGYSINELREYYELITKKKLHEDNDVANFYLTRWIWRTEVFSIAQPAIKKGAETVVSSYFGDYEWDVIKELTKNLKGSVKKNTNALP